MEPILVKFIEKPDLTDPVLVEGLPGVGNVGKIAAEYLVEKLNATKFAEIYSKHFPPQVLLRGDGLIYLVRNELYYYRNSGGRDLILLIGDYQGLTADGQYDLSYEVLRIAKELGAREILTLGGYATGRLEGVPRVFGAATHSHLIPKYTQYGVIFSETEPGGGIVGAAGLLLGLGMNFFDMAGVCLMGETTGYFSDPRSAREVLKVAVRALEVPVDLTDIEESARRIEEIAMRIAAEEEEEEGRRDLGYIG